MANKIKHMMKTQQSWLVAVLLLSALFFQAATPEDVTPLRPEKKHAISSQVIANLLRQYHFMHKKIDDNVSSELLDSYIDIFDRNRMYFLASDIAQFEKFRTSLDDNIRQGDLDAAYLIFNTFHERLNQRVAYVEKRLQEPFDFTLKETFQKDRSDAPWASTIEELNDLWRKKLKNEALSLILAREKNKDVLRENVQTDVKPKGRKTQDVRTTLLKRYHNFQKRINQYNSEDVFKNFANALCEIYDPHTSYFSPRSAENFNIDMSLSLEGIGAQLTTEDEYTKVVRIITGGPADRSKQLWANDFIIGVAQGRDGEMEDVVGMRLDDVVQKIRGPKGSVVRLEVIPAGSPSGSPPKEITLVRDKVVLEEKAAKSDTVEFMYEGQPYKLGIINIPSFYVDLNAQARGDKDYKSTSRDVRRILKELESAGVDGIIIDLRRDGGGSLQEAIELTGLFIEEGPVVQVKNSIGSKRVEMDPDPAVVYEGPLAVLVDRFSASASEIFSSAIQDYGRGLILGSQTYGKGTVQNLLSLDRFISLKDGELGQMKITIAKFYRITGGTTQHRGVIPDISFPSIYNVLDYVGEDNQPHALPWDEISPAIYTPVDQVSMYLSKLRTDSKKRTMKNREFQYILEDIEQYKKEQSHNAVTLNKAERQAERKKLEDIKFRRANERRIAKGLQPLKPGESIPKDDQAPDAILEESQQIMAEYVHLSEATRKSEIAKAAENAKNSKKKTKETTKLNYRENN